MNIQHDEIRITDEDDEAFVNGYQSSVHCGEIHSVVNNWCGVESVGDQTADKCGEDMSNDNFGVERDQSSDHTVLERDLTSEQSHILGVRDKFISQSVEEINPTVRNDQYE